MYRDLWIYFILRLATYFLVCETTLIGLCVIFTDTRSRRVAIGFQAVEQTFLDELQYIGQCGTF